MNTRSGTTAGARPTSTERAAVAEDLPLGGSTGCDHTSTAAIDEAAGWLASQASPPSPIVPALRSRFGLSAVEACVAIREAGRRRQASGVSS